METTCEYCGELTGAFHPCSARDRHLLAKGVPADAPICYVHRDLVLAPGASEILRETISSGTALLPVCGNCTKTGLGRNNFDVPKGIDNCSCANAIVTSDCWHCVIGGIQFQKAEQLQQRQQHLAVGNGQFRTEVRCACGNLVFQPEEARRCVACFGLVTRPFRNFAGYDLEFEFATMHVVKITPSEATKVSLEIGNAAETVDNAQAPSPKSTPSTESTDGIVVDIPDWVNNGDGDQIDGSSFGQLFGAQALEYDLSNSLLNTSFQPFTKGPSPPADKPVFATDQARVFRNMGLNIPITQIPPESELSAGKKVDMLLLANRDGVMKTTDVPLLLTTCGFGSVDAKKIGAKVADALKKFGKTAKCLGVLFHLRQGGWIEQGD